MKEREKKMITDQNRYNGMNFIYVRVSDKKTCKRVGLKSELSLGFIDLL